eukprot:6125253-Lingulodinium_polyedra.AAC.1
MHHRLGGHARLQRHRHVHPPLEELIRQVGHRLGTTSQGQSPCGPQEYCTALQRAAWRDGMRRWQTSSCLKTLPVLPGRPWLPACRR